MNFIKISPSIEAFRKAKSGHKDLCAYRSSTFEKEKFLYFVAGIHGNDIEGIFVLEQLLKWMQQDLLLDVPIILLPILNLDGYLANIKENAKGVDLDKAFPYYLNRPIVNKGVGIEVPFMEELFMSYPPQLLFTFRSIDYGVKANKDSSPSIFYSRGAKEVAEFFVKYNEYRSCEFKDENGCSYHNMSMMKGCLESYVINFFYSDVVVFNLPKINKTFTLPHLFNKHEVAFKNFLHGQRFF